MKQVTIINGMADDSYAAFEASLSLVLKQNNVQAQVFLVRDMHIQYCCGCFGCWVKTPGKCIQDDDMPLLLKSIINSDLTVFISPINMGFVSSGIKRVNDKMIPLVHPYIGIFGGECHHFKRYDKYPKLGLILVDKKGYTQDVHETITAIYKRLAINLKTELAFSVMSQGSMEEIDYAINHS